MEPVAVAVEEVRDEAGGLPATGDVREAAAAIPQALQ
jgi:hypothetical protein